MQNGGSGRLQDGRNDGSLDWRFLNGFTTGLLASENNCAIHHKRRLPKKANPGKRPKYSNLETIASKPVQSHDRPSGTDNENERSWSPFG